MASFNSYLLFVWGLYYTIVRFRADQTMNECCSDDTTLLNSLIEQLKMVTGFEVKYDVVQ